METNGNIFPQKHVFSHNKYSCEYCNIKTNNKKDITKHLLTPKHLKREMETKNPQFSPISPNETHKCELCNKKYTSRSGIWKHSKICNKNETESNNTDTNVINMIMEVVKQNSEFKDLLIEQNKQIIELSSKPLVNNTTNNSFNLNFFLNETCKNALNITDFVNQLQLSVKDLEETGRLGYVEGISKIFINGLKQLDINQRPLHCSDSKRETMYIKDENIWEKEDVTHLKLTNAIKDVAHKNIQQIPFWTLKYPQHKDITSKCNDTYMKLVSEAMSGTTMEESDKNYKKIAKNIMKETVIDK